jgi:type I restriction enzyme S subunit
VSAAEGDGAARMVGPWAVPEGWTWARLGSIGAWAGGGTPSKANAGYWTGGAVPWVSPKDMKVDVIGDTADMITETAVANSAAKYVPKSSVLMVIRSGILRHTFPVAITDRVVTLNQDMRALTPRAGVEPAYVAQFLTRNARAILHDCAKDGTTVNSIDVSALQRTLVPIPPSAEQHRIVARIDALFSEIAEGEAALSAARRALETYRRALLKAAVTGELTADWREANKPAETGHDLLARIRAERETSAPPRERGRSGVALASYKTRQPVLPDGWVWSTLNELKIADQRNGISIAGSASPPGTKALRLDALTEKGINLEAIRYIPLPENRIQNYKINAGDFLISRANGSSDLVGRAVYVAEASDTVVFPDTMIRYPLGSDRAIGTWLELAWASPPARQQIGQLAKTTAGILKISQEDIALVALPVPPLAELEEILRRVSDSLSAASDALAALDAEAADVARLRQSILKAAFEGRLVPQDPDDEPAAAMLARVRQEGDGAAVSIRRPRRAPPVSQIDSI